MAMFSHTACVVDRSLQIFVAAAVCHAYAAAAAVDASQVTPAEIQCRDYKQQLKPSATTQPALHLLLLPLLTPLLLLLSQR